MARDLYGNGKLISYKEGDRSLHRDPFVYKKDIGDIAYIVKEGDTLTSLSNKFYSDPLKWGLIADVNNIDNPFILKTGLSIIIPNIDNYNL